MKCIHGLRVFLMIGVTACVAGCSSGSGSAPGSSSSTPAQSGSVYVLGTDAPLPSVVSFAVNVQSITLSNGSATPVSILNGAQTVDFARFNGLSTLLDFNSIPAGTYTTATITLGSATLGYLNTQSGTAPTIATMPATLTQSAVTINLASPFVVNAGDMDALRFDFDLRKSIQVDANGQITGQVTPTLDLKALSASDPERYIDEFDAGVVSIDAAANSFVIQGPHGRQYTVQLSLDYRVREQRNHRQPDYQLHRSGLRLLCAQQPDHQRGLRRYSVAGWVLGSRADYQCDPGARCGEWVQPVRPRRVAGGYRA